ncbi:MAG TPA: GMP synthase [Chitinophagaceae bacterium]|nr:GMP synthase [Chitinophagaceae bacterium]
MQIQRKKLRVAILDLYNGEPNQGMGCIRNILNRYAAFNHLEPEFDFFDVRQKLEMADSSYQFYISSGGPGSPLESQGGEWEQRYFSLIRQLENINASGGTEKKYVFFICHSFQLMCRDYALGQVCLRKSPSYGVFPVHKTTEGAKEKIFQDLDDPFYAVDSREWQVIDPSEKQLKATGATILALEKERPHVPLQRALMAVRFSPYFVGTQFHPEADPAAMAVYMQEKEKKSQMIADLGEEKYNKMLTQLMDPGKITHIRNMVIPSFMDIALNDSKQIIALA